MAFVVRWRDPFEVLGVTEEFSDQEIKSAYRKLVLKFHPDKNANNLEACELFIEVVASYSILSDPERRQYSTYGFEDPETQDMEDMEIIDLSSLGTVSTLFFALLSKLGVPMKTLISATVVGEALSDLF